MAGPRQIANDDVGQVRLAGRDRDPDQAMCKEGSKDNADRRVLLDPAGVPHHPDQAHGYEAELHGAHGERDTCNACQDHAGRHCVRDGITHE